MPHAASNINVFLYKTIWYLKWIPATHIYFQRSFFINPGASYPIGEKTTLQFDECKYARLCMKMQICNYANMQYANMQLWKAMHENTNRPWCNYTNMPASAWNIPKFHPHPADALVQNRKNSCTTKCKKTKGGGDYGPGRWTVNHTSYLSRNPWEFSCKFFLAGVNFYRSNAKNWQFTVYFAVITQKIGNLLCILS